MGKEKQNNDREKLVSKILMDGLGKQITKFKNLLQSYEGERPYETLKQAYIGHLIKEAKDSCTGLNQQEIEVGIKHLLGIEDETTPVK